MTLASQPIELHQLGHRAYLPVWSAMRELTDTRDETTPDQFWLVEHDPVFTQGQAGKPEHVLMPGDIPVVKTDRGGQVTYHGPGQIVLYPLLDVRRGKIGVRELVTALENSVIDVLALYGVSAWAKPDAPGVYAGMQVTRLADLVALPVAHQVGSQLASALAQRLDRQLVDVSFTQ